MAVLEKIRVKFGVFISVIIALALLSFIIDPQTLQNVSSAMSSKYNVGEINGEKISYTDFNKTVENLSSVHQTLSGSSIQGEEAQESIRQEAWQQYINKNMFLKNVAAAGLTLGEDEKYEITSGVNISPVIAQYFADPTTGAVSYEALNSFKQQMADDQTGTLKNAWYYLKEQAYTQQMYAKYASLFTASSFQDAVLLSERIDGTNNSADIDFVYVPGSYMADSTVVVTPAEVKAYYNLHKDEYKQDDMRDLEYVVFEVKPSEADVLDAQKAFDKVVPAFATAANYKTFLLQNSDRALDTYYYGAGELKSKLSAAIDEFVFSGASANGAVKEFSDADAFYAVKVIDSKQLPAQVYVQHILLVGADAAKADSLVRVINAKKSTFEAVAEQYSVDFRPAAEDPCGIGYMSQTMMIKGLESVLEAPQGQLQVLSTTYGKHIVRVTERKDVAVRKQVAVLQKDIIPSNITTNDYYAKANNIAVAAKGTVEGLRAAAQDQKVYLQSAPKITNSTSSLGSVAHTKEVTRWAFDQKKAGKVSDIFTIDNKYFVVAAVTGTYKEGYASLAEKTDQITFTLKIQKQRALDAEKVAAKIAGCTTLDAVATALGATVSHKDNVTFATNGYAQAVDPALVGVASVLPVGTLSAPIQGVAGTYVVVVKERTQGAFFTEDDAKRADNQVQLQLLNSVLPVMAKDAEVVNHLNRFF